MTIPLVQHYPEERRLASVLFADVQGFTTLADHMDFEDVSDLMREVWALVDQVIETHGGYIDKHIGDAVMAVWGAPHASEDDAERAVLAAMAMHTAVGHYAENSPREGANQLKMRVGVNTGPVLAGYVGGRGEYTVLGDTVNIASRLETTADAGTIVIGESTYRLVRGAFRVRRLDPLQVKGKSHPLNAYMVEGTLDQPGHVRYRSLGGLETYMVGREAEMARLNMSFQEAIETQSPVLVLVRGESGMGKSRLIMEFTNQLEITNLTLHVLSSRSLAQANRVPFLLWKLLWQQRFGLTENDPPDVARDKLLRGLQAIWKRLPGPASATEAAHFVGKLIGIEWPDSPYLEQFQNDPSAQMNRAVEMTREILKRLCIGGPTLMIFDDLQWADSGSLDLLEFIAEPSPNLPLFILGAMRPGILRKRPELQQASTLISLKALPTEPHIVAEAYPVLRNLPSATLAQIARVAEGNPYFMEEIVKGLMVSTSSGAETQGTPIPGMGFQMPDSLHATLQARLDALSPQAREVAILASVIGRVFWVGGILAAAQHQTASTGFLRLTDSQQGTENTISQGLAELVRAELAFPRADSMYAGEQEYIFKHSLLRDVAYSLIPIKSRRQYHQAIALWLIKFAASDFAST
ncbi:MAG TPA: adenylate/guanylate cyclase domain-containing protein, partial [Anaerolineales bacterium]|nr:adenylate/guanylate cyclase domain-containing protein [Anaerolineales bacterium]